MLLGSLEQPWSTWIFRGQHEPRRQAWTDEDAMALSRYLHLKNMLQMTKTIRPKNAGSSYNSQTLHGIFTYIGVVLGVNVCHTWSVWD